MNRAAIIEIIRWSLEQFCEGSRGDLRKEKAEEEGERDKRLLVKVSPCTSRRSNHEPRWHLIKVVSHLLDVQYV